MIIGLLVLGIVMTPYDTEAVEQSENLYFWHKSFGILVFILMLARLAVKLRSEIPELPSGLPKHEVLASNLTHKLLYILAILVPVLGYIQSSTYEYSSGVHFFFFELPELLPDNKQHFDLANLVHRICGYALLFFIVLHVAGALKHRFLDKKENDVLGRML